MKTEIGTRARGLWLASACIGAFACAQSATTAAAAVVDVTFSGTVIAGVDAQSQFGGGDLTGDTYVATYEFDSSRGVVVDNGGGGERLTGDFSASETDPLISASVTVYKAGDALGSITAQPQAEFENQLATFTNISPGELNAQAFYLGPVHSIAIDNLMISDATPAALFSPASFYGTPGGIGDSVIEEFTGDSVSELVYLAPTHATFAMASPSAAPEPSVWALMIAGVGMIGAALRFGRRSGLSATA